MARKPPKKMFLGGLADMIAGATGLVGKVGGAAAPAMFAGMTGAQLPMLTPMFTQFLPGGRKPGDAPNQQLDLSGALTLASQFMQKGGPIKYMAGGKLHALPSKSQKLLGVGGNSHAQGGTVVKDELGLDQPVELEKGETVTFLQKGGSVYAQNSAGGKTPFVFSKQLKVKEGPYKGRSFADVSAMLAKDGGDLTELAHTQEMQKMPDGGVPGGFDITKILANLDEASKPSALEQVADFVPGAASIAGSFLAPKPKFLNRTVVDTQGALQTLERLPEQMDYRPARAANKEALAGVLNNRAASSADIAAAHTRNLQANFALNAEEANQEAALRSDKFTKQADVRFRGAQQQAEMDANVHATNKGIANADQDARLAMRLQGAGQLAQGVYNREGRRREAAWRKAQGEILGAMVPRAGTPVTGTEGDSDTATNTAVQSAGVGTGAVAAGNTRPSTDPAANSDPAATSAKSGLMRTMSKNIGSVPNAAIDGLPAGMTLADQSLDVSQFEPEILTKLNDINDVMGGSSQINSTNKDWTEVPGRLKNSLHPQNKAVDIQIPKSLSPEQVKTKLGEMKKRLGPGYDVVKKQGHFHIEYDPRTRQEKLEQGDSIQLSSERGDQPKVDKEGRYVDPRYMEPGDTITLDRTPGPAPRIDKDGNYRSPRDMDVGDTIKLDRTPGPAPKVDAEGRYVETSAEKKQINELGSKVALSDTGSITVPSNKITPEVRRALQESYGYEVKEKDGKVTIRKAKKSMAKDLGMGYAKAMLTPLMLLNKAVYSFNPESKRRKSK
jgi:hypothetical protein